jgi:peptidyl-tRNA hydrolase
MQYVLNEFTRDERQVLEAESFPAALELLLERLKMRDWNKL